MFAQPTFKGKLLFQELVVFGLIQLLGLWAGIRLFCKVALVEARVTISFWEFVIAFAFATFLFVLFLKILKGNLFFRSFFTFVIFLGCFILFDILISSAAALLFAVLATILRFILPRIWSHNLIIALASAGIGANLGVSLPVAAVLIILFILSLYDYIAVYKTTHMVVMFRELLARKVIFAIIFPEKLSAWFVNLKKIKSTAGFMFLGTGDIILPLLLAVSALAYGLESAVFVLGGSLVGVVVLHTLFVSQVKRTPMPALPPIAMFSVFGFLISLLLK